MNRQYSPYDVLGIFASQPVVRDFNNYSLSFPCKPYDLRLLAKGFQLLVWADFLLVAGILTTIGAMFWFCSYSESFRTFCESMTPESVAALQAMSGAEQQDFIREQVFFEEIPQIVYLGGLGMMGGMLLNTVGSIFCMTCPNRVVPNAWFFCFAWFAAFFLSMLFCSLGPLFLLIAWQLWLGFLFRLSLLLGQNMAISYLRKIHRCVFYSLISFLGAWFLPNFLTVPQYASYCVIFCLVAVLTFFIGGFVCYVKLLTLLRQCIGRMIWYWDHGNDELMNKAERCG